MFNSFWKFRLSIIWVNFAIIAAFGLIGWGIGTAFGNWKAGLVVAVLISFGPAMAATVRVVKRQAQKMVKDAAATSSEGGERETEAESRTDHE